MEQNKLSEAPEITVSVDNFGTFEDPINRNQENVLRCTWKNSAKNVLVQVISYGATITRIEVPDRHNVAEDIVLGFDNMEGYLGKNNPYFGATIGRVCNRIGFGKFVLNGEKIQVSRNLNNTHTLHGGFISIDKRNWNTYVEGNKVIMTLVVPDGEEGFPGSLLITVTFELLKNNSFKIIYTVGATKPSPVNLTNHSYFNLAGHAAGYPEIYKHIVSINADKITETDSDSIPTGKLLNVGGTLFDLRVPQQLGNVMKQLPLLGYDDNFCITQGDKQELTFHARAIHPETGRTLEVYSNQPGIQLYTSNGMPDPLGVISPENLNLDYFTYSEGKSSSSDPNKLAQFTMPEPPIVGKKGAKYLKHGAFCLETQKYPDGVNHSNFPSTILNPGQIYNHEVVYVFGVQTN